MIATLGRVSEHRLLDRLIRGRAWIAIVAFALLGIVTMQLVLLKLNASVGRSLVSEAALQRENAALSIENSELAAGDRVESSAVRLGMEVIPTGALRFLTARPPSDVQRGAAALNTPVSSAPAGSAEATPGSSTAVSSTPASSTAASSSPASAGGESSSSSPSSSSSSSEQSASSGATQTSTSSSEEARSRPGESASPTTAAQPSGEATGTTAPSTSGAGTGASSPEAQAQGGTRAGGSG